MQYEPTKKSMNPSIKGKKRQQNRKKLMRTWVSIVVILVLIPAVVVLTPHMGPRRFYVAGVLIILLAMIPFAVSFEGRKPQARELAILAVMCTIAVISRAVFVMIPSFKPMVGIIMIIGISLGSAAGFLTGVISSFVSNFLFGQGLWTPWQMFAFGLAGFLAGILAKAGILKPEKRLRAAVFGAVVIMVLVGPILDTCTVFTMISMIDTETILEIYMAGIPFNAVHAAAVFLTMLLLCRPIAEKLERIKVKYGIMENDSDPQ